MDGYCKRIRALREGKGFSPKEAASEIGTDVDSYLKKEEGITPLYTDEAIILAALYGVDVDYLSGISDVKRTS